MLSFENFARFAHLKQHFSPISFLSLPNDYIEGVFSYTHITQIDPTCRHHTFISSQTLPHHYSPHRISIAEKSERVQFWHTSHSPISPSSPSHTLTITLASLQELFTRSHFYPSLHNTTIHTQLPPSFYLSYPLHNNTNTHSCHFPHITKIVKNTYRRNSFHTFPNTPLLRFHSSTMKLPLLFPNHH